MMTLTKRLQDIKKAANGADIANISRGIEKESLRVDTSGHIAKTAHPQSLGSALTHPSITTDYSEALLEFITQPSNEPQHLLNTLSDLHAFTYQHIGQESLWVNSMPCMLPQDSAIPIAQYGSSNSGMMKTIYRRGLSHRYGRAMQTIAGVHYNFSLSDTFWHFLLEQERTLSHEPNSSTLQNLQAFKTQGYFRLIRNFRRYFWLLLYLFGAAPSVCRSFVKHRQHQLLPVGEDLHSLHSPHATSLRMGDLGYQSSAQQSLLITYNSLVSYIKTLRQAITQPHADYEAIAIKDQRGVYQQLTSNLLQIENEFYSVIRPKRSTQRGQTALNALSNGGVEYIEVRCLDLNPFEPVGISQQQIRFLDVFLVYCLLEDSPPSDHHECHHIQENQRRMVYQGRNPQLKLFHQGSERSARQWGQELMTAMQGVAELLDGGNQGEHLNALNCEAAKLKKDKLTPSARILEQLQEQQLSFYRWAMNSSLRNRDYFREYMLDQDRQKYYQELAEHSHREQQALERENQTSLEDFLASYYEQYQLRPNKHQPSNALGLGA